MTRVIWCTPDRRDESSWIAEVTGRGFTVVRRCVEATDVLAAATIEDQAAIVVDVDTPRLSADIVSALPGRDRRRIVAIAADDDALVRARSWGLTAVVHGLSADLVDRVIDQLQVGEQPEERVSSGPGSASQRDRREAHRAITAVYGAIGAPGRSTVALGLAESWAHAGERVCLIDADTIGPSLALLVGMTEDVSGLLVASRYADQGALDARSLATACRRLTERLWLMSGIGSADRWHQLRPHSLERIVSVCSQNFDRVVIDTNPLLSVAEVDDALAGGLPARDAASKTVLQHSHAVVVVTQPEAVSVVRMTADLPHVVNAIEHSRLTVVANRAPRRNANVRSRVTDVLAESGMSVPVHAVPDDSSVQACRTSGSLLSENTATRRVRKSFAKIRDSLAA